MKTNKLITLIFSLLLFCNLAIAEQSNIEQTADLTQTVEQSLSPKDFMTDPDKLLTVWGDEPIPLSSYTDEEKRLQQYINEKTAVSVATYSPKSQEKEWTKYDHEEITPYTWKVLDLRLTESNGKTFDISLLRPHWWLRNIGADKVGNRFYLKIPDVEEGWAVVKAIRINQLDTRLWDEARNGDFVYRPVTATFQHESDDVIQLYFENNQEPLGVTFTHPIYSVDRNDYISAGKLKIGEQVKTRQGLTTLTEKKQLTGTHPVYNLEIYRDHNYMVSMDSILVHNSCPAWIKDITKSQKIAPDLLDKGVHFNIGKVELKALPDHKGGVMFKPVFSSSSSKDVSKAINQAKKAMKNSDFKDFLIKHANAGFEMSRNTGSGKAVEFKMLKIAIERSN